MIYKNEKVNGRRKTGGEKMKVGILSMQRVVNNGSFLQAYALKKIVESYGHQVVFVDFHVDKIVKPYLRVLKRGMRVLGEYIHKPEWLRLHNKKRELNEAQYRIFMHDWDFQKIYKRDCYRDLHLQKIYQYNTSVDLMIFGSDEIFNTVQYAQKNREAWELYGEDCQAKKMISYAASCGFTRIEGIERYHMEEKTRELLSRFTAFSVRDENTQQFVKHFTGRDSEIDIDPVLLYEFPEVELKCPEKDYILIYAYSGRICDPEEIRAIKNLAAAEHKKLISVNVYQGWEDEFILAHPFELLSWFRYADYVVTDTFHGAVISIKYQKNFGVFIRDSNREKLGYLLKMFNLENRQIRHPDELDQVIHQEMPAEAIRDKIAMYQKQAYRYLDTYLK